MKRALLATALAVAAFDANAQGGRGQERVSNITTSALGTGVNTGINDPRYLPGRNQYTGVANLWMTALNNPQQIAGACTGSLLYTGRHILTAAHCVSTATNSIDVSGVRVRFRNPNAATGFVEYQSSAITVKSGYTGIIEDEQDVAIITLSQTADNAFERYNIHNGSALNQRTVLAGYGLTGDGVTGSTNSSNCQFDGLTGGACTGREATLRRGYNVFESYCSENDNCFSPAAQGGQMVADFDNPLGNQFNPGGKDWMCGDFNTCTPGLGLDEVSIGGGDSGSAAFIESTNGIAGVASWGFVQDNFGAYFGYACVANNSGSAACQQNYNFIVNTIGAPSVVIPEPSTYALMATGLVALAAIRRRRRA
jgi:V8-like Glu-specific endopeptidase